MIPFVPIIQENEKPFSMFQDLKLKYSEWVLDILEYDSKEKLIKCFEEAILKPALANSQVLRSRRSQPIRKRHVGEY